MSAKSKMSSFLYIYRDAFTYAMYVYNCISIYMGCVCAYIHVLQIEYTWNHQPSFFCWPAWAAECKVDPASETDQQTSSVGEDAVVIYKYSRCCRLLSPGCLMYSITDLHVKKKKENISILLGIPFWIVDDCSWKPCFLVTALALRYDISSQLKGDATCCPSISPRKASKNRSTFTMASSLSKLSRHLWTGRNTWGIPVSG